MTAHARICIMGSNFIDRIHPVALDQPLAIGSGVGDGAPPRVANRADDVRAVQRALNGFSPINGGPTPKLKVDGICGPLTRGAIGQFQRKWGLRNSKGAKVSDAIVDVQGPTIERLRLGSADLLTDAPALFMQERPAVGAVITAAQAALDLAMAQLTLPHPLGGGRTSAALEQHFKARTPAEKQAVIALAQKVFRRMHAAIGHVPFGWVLAADEPPQEALGAVMFTFAGGFDPARIPLEPGEQPIRRTPTYHGYPISSIYICPKGRTLAGPQFRYAMVHELAHYVSNDRNIPYIDDIAYFHLERAKYDRMTWRQAMVNADSYARFAFACVQPGEFRFP